MQAAANIENNSASIVERLNSYVALTKPRIAFMLVLTSAAGFYLGSATFDVVLFLHSMTAIALLSFGVATLNQVIERKTDKLMNRTAGRPLPSGRLNVSEALLFGALLTSGAVAYFFIAVNALTGVLALAVIAGYVFVYTPLKTISSASTAIGAIPGAMPPLMGWTAATGEISLFSWFLFATLFFWQFPHFLAIAWMYKEEYKQAGIKMLPVLEEDGRYTARQMVSFAVMLIPVSIAPFFFGYAGIVFLIGAVLAGTWFLIASIRTARSKSVDDARKAMLVSVIYLPVYFALLVIGF